MREALRKARKRLAWPPLVCLALILASVGTWAAFVATTGSPGSSFAAAASGDTTSPTISRSAIEKAAGGGAGYLKQGQTYYVYAQVTDDVAVNTVTANVAVASNVLTTGGSSVSMTTGGGPWTVDGQSYNYRSASQTADGVISQGSKTYRITAIDTSSNQAGPTDYSVTVDNTAPTVARTAVERTAGGGSGYVKQGQTYYVYAQVTDSSSGVASVTTNVNTVTVGQTAVSMTTSGGPWTVGGQSYNYRSASLTADNPLSEGSKTIFGTATDNVSSSAGFPTTTAVVDNTAPTISATQVCGGASCSANYVGVSKTYYIYANASDASSGIDTVTANVNSITSGQTAVALPTCSANCTVNGTSYSYKSAAKTSDAGVANGNFTVTANDNVANSTTTSNQAYTVDNTAPTISSTRICGGTNTNCTASYVGQGNYYRVYAEASDAGSGIDTTSLTTTDTNLTNDSTPATLTYSAGGYNVGGTTYHYVSDARLAKSSLSGTPSYNVTASDNAANQTTTSNPTVTVDNTAPTIGSTVIRKTSSSGYSAGYIRQGGTYDTYMNISDATSGIWVGCSSVNLSNITANGASTGIAAASNTVEGVSYNYHTFASYADNPLSAGSKTYDINACDNAGNVATLNNSTVTVDNTAPSASDIQAVDGGGTAGKPQAGDTITYTFSEPIDPDSIKSGWTGASDSTMSVVFTDSAGNDSMSVTGANLSSVMLVGNFVTTDRTFTSSTMVMSGSTITITLGTASGGTITEPTASQMSWGASSASFDRAGNAASTTAANESGPSDKNF